MSETKDLHYIYNNITEKYGEAFIKNFPKIANHISQYINNNTDVLQTKNVGKHLYYTKAIENDFFDCAGVDKNEIVKIVSSAPSIPYKYNDEALTVFKIRKDSYIKKIDAIASGDIDELNKILKSEGIAEINKIDFMDIKESYFGDITTDQILCRESFVSWLPERSEAGGTESSLVT